MTKKRLRKALALGIVVAVGLSLTACYVPPDDLTDDPNSVPVGNKDTPWKEYDVATAIPTQVPTPTPTIAPQMTESPTDNWNWGSSATNQGGGTQPQQTIGIGVATNPVVSLETPTVKPASQTIPVITTVPRTVAPGSAATPKPTATGSLKLGSSGSDVRTVQSRLKTLGYYTGSVDGDFGEATRAAVIAFQRANGLEVDGKVGAETLAKLNSSSAITYKQANATATPAPSLKLGSSGSEVRTVQSRLKTLGYYTGSVDGDFGEGTQQAVILFQRANGLEADGKVGAATLAKLNSSSAVTYKQAYATATPKPTPKPTATPKPTSTPRTDIYLEPGSTGDNVKKLQNRLIELGYLTGTADGVYGGSTEAAVRAFQSRTTSLYEDGKAGPLTLEALYSSKARSASSVAASVGETLELGSQGNAVKALQKRLRELGYLKDSADGSYGANTVAAVTAFQIANGLKADGKAGTQTLNAIYSSETAKGTATPAPQATIKPDAGSSTITTTGYTTLRSGDESTAVKTLQQTLKNYGYYTGSVDGVYGSGTVAAVTAFQKAMDLKVDGVAGPATQRALYKTSGSSIEYATLRPGDSSTAVKNLQYTLYELGYYDDKIDGVYGTTTSDAVRAFQIRNSVSPVDGIAGNKTLQALYSSSAISATKKSSTFIILRVGDYGEEVLEMKQALISLGYPATSGTNIFDDQTRDAVLLFQKYNGLKADGVAGEETQSKLYSGTAIRNPE